MAKLLKSSGRVVNAQECLHPFYNNLTFVTSVS